MRTKNLAFLVTFLFRLFTISGYGGRNLLRHLQPDLLRRHLERSSNGSHTIPRGGSSRGHADSLDHLAVGDTNDSSNDRHMRPGRSLALGVFRLKIPDLRVEQIMPVLDRKSVV